MRRARKAFVSTAPTEEETPEEDPSVGAQPTRGKLLAEDLTPTDTIVVCDVTSDTDGRRRFAA